VQRSPCCVGSRRRKSNNRLGLNTRSLNPVTSLADRFTAGESNIVIVVRRTTPVFIILSNRIKQPSRTLSRSNEPLETARQENAAIPCATPKSAS